MMSRVFPSFLFPVLLFSCISPAGAQQHRGAPATLAVDVVFHNDKSVFYGVITDKTDDQVTLVVDRARLKQIQPQYYQKHLAAEKIAWEEARQEFVTRIDQWIIERKDDTDLRLFLEDQKADVENQAGNDAIDSKRFTYLVFPASEVRRIVVQPAEDRQTAVVAWFHQLDEVETRPAAVLNRELVRRGVDIGQTEVDFSKEIPTRLQTDREWAIRKSIVEFEMRERLEFQGTGNTFVRRGEVLDPMALVQVMLEQGQSSSLQQIGEELGLPEFTRSRPASAPDKDGWRKQAAIAEKEGFLSFTITRLEQNLLESEVKVNVVFFARDEQGDWQSLASFTGTASALGQSNDDIDALKDDPQVREVLELAEGLGAGANIDKALRHGVATQAALQEGLDQLALFTERYIQNLQGPEIGRSPASK